MSLCTSSVVPNLPGAMKDRQDLDAVIANPVPDPVASLDQLADSLDLVLGYHSPGLREIRELPNTANEPPLGPPGSIRRNSTDCSAKCHAAIHGRSA